MGDLETGRRGLDIRQARPLQLEVDSQTGLRSSLEKGSRSTVISGKRAYRTVIDHSTLRWRYHRQSYFF